jgi:hypothetical protein
MASAQDYSLGKIYRITGNGVSYIGSTIQPLNERLTQHKYDYRKYLKGKYHYTTSYECVSDENCVIELIENYPCNNKTELERREGEIIQATECVNKNVAGRTDQEYKREYFQANREKIAEYQREYREANREANREKRAEYHREYREANRERIAEQNREYREANREKRAEYQREYRAKQKAQSTPPTD